MLAEVAVGEMTRAARAVAEAVLRTSGAADAMEAMLRSYFAAFVARRPGSTIGEAAAFLGVTRPTADPRGSRSPTRTAPGSTASAAVRRPRSRGGWPRSSPGELAAHDAGLEVLRRIGGAT